MRTSAQQDAVSESSIGGDNELSDDLGQTKEPTLFEPVIVKYASLLGVLTDINLIVPIQDAILAHLGDAEVVALSRTCASFSSL